MEYELTVVHTNICVWVEIEPTTRDANSLATAPNGSLLQVKVETLENTQMKINTKILQLNQVPVETERSSSNSLINN